MAIIREILANNEGVKFSIDNSEGFFIVKLQESNNYFKIIFQDSDNRFTQDSYFFIWMHKILDALTSIATQNIWQAKLEFLLIYHLLPGSKTQSSWNKVIVNQSLDQTWIENIYNNRHLITKYHNQNNCFAYHVSVRAYLPDNPKISIILDFVADLPNKQFSTTIWFGSFEECRRTIFGVTGIFINSITEEYMQRNHANGSSKYIMHNIYYRISRYYELLPKI